MKPLARYGSWPAVLGAFLAATVAAAPVIFVLAMVIGGRPVSGQDLLSKPWLVFLAILVSDLAFVLTVYLLLVRRHVASWADLGVRRPARSPLLAGILWGLAFLAVSTAASALLGLFGVQQTQAQEFPLEGAGPLVKGAIWVAGVLIVPFAEELFFRGYVFQAMSERKGLIRGLAYSSLIFGAAHGNLSALLPLTAGAMVLALAYRRSGTLWTTVVAHAFNNAVALTALMLATSAPSTGGS